MTKTKLQRGFYPIYLSDIKRLIGYCNTWGFGNKDTCKYVADVILDKLVTSNAEGKFLIRETLYIDLISIVHDINNGGFSNGKELLIKID